ncbi:FtsB family cell division protein [Roseospirillum parvum]|uniref:Cell division protein FtsB n=1 Tax=Roseospirillum parvum TaxID=83401 RepID=A0A1G7YGM7_9PROT|nr:septum formation initiator family protein [Roseospirillum parvum]SDG95613.1 Cell division protein FtsB [Roseospirillum parvum]
MRPTHSDLKDRLRRAVGPMIGAVAVVYFGFHTVHGDRGLLRWWQVRQELEQARVEAAGLAAQRAELAERVRLLRPDSLDADMVEELARRRLGMGYPGERVVPLVPGEGLDEGQ